MTLPVDPARFGAYCLAMAGMALSPGPANVFFIRTGLGGQRARIIWGLAGVNSATIVWYIGAALGLAALMASFPKVFQIIAVAGGAYIFWLGFKTLRASLKPTTQTTAYQASAERTLWETLRDGFMVQILNPKALLFFSVVLPPFLDIYRPIGPQMGLCGFTTIFMDVCAMSAYGFGALKLSHLLAVPQNRQKFDRILSMVLMLMGVFIGYHAISDLLLVKRG